ncbi:MAG: hypothetical protein ABEL76_02030 [Bradymonadaceae bacterium]
MSRRRRILTLCAILAGIGPTSRAEADVSIAEWNDGSGSFTLSGYVRSITGYHDLGYGEPLLEASRSLNMGVGRLEWNAEFGPDVRARIHDELTWNVQSASGGAAGGGLFGVDASRGSDRTVDLESTIVDETGARLTHDVDRLAVDVYTEAVDLTLGRQGITWGKASVFPVADVWSRFSPFDLDTEKKSGIDAARALVYPNMNSELDLVVADRGSLEDLSAGIRYASTVGRADLYGAAGKFWNEILAMGGVSVVLERIKLRAEAVGPWKLEEREVALPRATAGIEWFGTDFTLGSEYHFNGLGAASPSGYAAQLSSESYARGESYLLGRHYAGIYGSYTGIPDVRMMLSAIGNLTDPSAIVSPTVRYDVAQNASIGLGALLSAGGHPDLRAGPQFQSEFGAYGDFFYLELAAYY